MARVPRDFVELPSQIMENWVLEPEVLKVYAKHWKTGEVILGELVAKVQGTRRFNQGFATVEYLAASYLDMDWHTIADAKERNATAFEAFNERGISDQATARSFRANMLERPGTGDVMEAYVRFRGHAPSVQPLLVKRGLTGSPAVPATN